MLPWYLTSAMLHSYILCNCLQIIKFPLDIPIYQCSNDRPNIHLCMHPMKHPIQTLHDLAFLVPLNPIMDDCHGHHGLDTTVGWNAPLYMVFWPNWAVT